MGKSSSRKIWFFTGPRKQKPDGPIVLGNVIVDKRDVDYAKNELPPPPIGWHLNRRSATEENKSITLDKRSAQSFGLFTSFAQMVLGPSLDVDYGQSSDKSDTLNCERVDQTLFEPDDEYIRHSMQDPKVKKYMVQNAFSRPVYIITGIAIARGASRIIKKVKDKKMNVQFSVDTTLATGIPVTSGLKAGHAPGKTYTNSYDSSSDFVLGVTLMQVDAKRDGSFKTKNLDTGDFHEQIVPDRDAINNAVDLSNYSFKISDISAEDVEGYESGLQSGHDASGAECDFIYI